MREMKFRAFDKTKKDMFKVIQMDFEKRLVFARNLIYKEYVRFEDAIIMQYIGLKDIKGTEIYEGDILKEQVDNDEYIYVEVIYEKGVFMGKETKFEPEYPMHDFLNGWVIGNIYENSELLVIHGD